jgi:hypothetical protein
VLRIHAVLDSWHKLLLPITADSPAAQAPSAQQLPALQCHWTIAESSPCLYSCTGITCSTPVHPCLQHLTRMILPRLLLCLSRLWQAAKAQLQHIQRRTSAHPLHTLLLSWNFSSLSA